MPPFFYAKRLAEPEDVRPFLRDPVLHWKKGYSACELATSWISAGDFPSPVRNVIEHCPVYSNARLIEGFFEHEVDLRTRGRPSQTDLLVLALSKAGYLVIAVEGKADEAFGPLVSDWSDGSSGRAARLQSLCDALGIAPASSVSLRYQLLHRTVSALFEAQRYGARHALMLVHSFSPTDGSLADFLAFAEVVQMRGAGKNQVSEGRVMDGVEMRLAWVADRPA